MLNVINENDWTIIAITADWCKHCEHMKPVIDKYSEELKDIKLVRVNVQDEDKLEFLKKIDFESLPYFAVFHKKADLSEDPDLKHFIGGETGASEEVLTQIISMVRLHAANN